MWGSAPGASRSDRRCGGLSGALVLEMPTRQSLEVVARPRHRLGRRPGHPLARRARAPGRPRLRGHPGGPRRTSRWTHYVIGVAVVLVRHGVLTPPTARLEITSDLPASAGVASSEALEVATARALGAGALDALRLATLCQEAENHVVGAPCGIMDAGRGGLGEGGGRAADPVPPGLGGRSYRGAGGSRDRGLADGSPPQCRWPAVQRARAAAFMGKRMVEDTAGRKWSWVSELPGAAVADRRRTSMATPSSSSGAPAATTSR